MKHLFHNTEFDFVYDVDSNLGGDEWDRIANWCVKTLRHEDTFVEIGAHIGYMSAIVQKLKNPKRALYVEGDPRTIPLLTENLRRVGGNYRIVHSLVLDTPGEKTFYTNTANPAQSSVFQRGDLNSLVELTVPVTNMDELLKDVAGPIVMKIDAEFAEPLIWKGMKKSFPKIRKICMEFHPPGLSQYAGASPEAFWKEMEDDGFQIEYLNKNNIVLTNVRFSA